MTSSPTRSPAERIWGVRGGHNSSSNAATNGDNYTRLTNYHRRDTVGWDGPICRAGHQRRTCSAACGATQLSFLQEYAHAKDYSAATDGSFAIRGRLRRLEQPKLSRTSLGYVQSDAQVQYQAINEKFIVNMEGGQTVQVSAPNPAHRPARACKETQLIYGNQHFLRSGVIVSWS